jgi:hypothetical protein
MQLSLAVGWFFNNPAPPRHGRQKSDVFFIDQKSALFLRGVVQTNLIENIRLSLRQTL